MYKRGVIAAILLMFCCYSQAKVRFDIQNADKQTTKNIKLYFEQVAEPVNDEISTYANQLNIAGQKALNSLGKYQGIIDIEYVQSDSHLLIIAKVNPGPTVLVNQFNVNIEGGEPAPFEKIITASLLSQNTPFHHGHYSTLKNNLVSQAQTLGYFDAKFTTSKVALSVVNNTADIQLTYQLNKRYTFGNLQFKTPNDSEQIIRNFTPFSQGQAFNSELFNDFTSSINNTGYFDYALVRPIKNTELNTVDVDIELVDKPTSRLSLGAGYATDSGPRVKVANKWPKLNSNGDSLGLSVQASFLSQQITGSYKYPLSNPNTHYLNFNISYERQIINDITFNKNSITTSLVKFINRRWQFDTFLKYDVETGNNDGQEKTTKLILPGSKATRVQGNNITWGNNHAIGLEFSNKFWFSDLNLIRLNTNNKWLRSIGKHRLITKVQMGALWSKNFTATPSSLRYTAGGDQSIRGYPYASISETNNSGEIVGARYLHVYNLDYSHPIIQNWRGLLFMDTGTANNRFMEEFKYSSGLGISWTSPVGPIRLFLAKALLDDNAPDYAIHLTMGPDL